MLASTSIRKKKLQDLVRLKIILHVVGRIVVLHEAATASRVQHDGARRLVHGSKHKRSYFSGGQKRSTRFSCVRDRGR